MLESHQRFHSANGKRQILIADDELINRELLRAVLQDTYELHFATNGQEALDAMRKHRETLSLVLLDLLMPVMSGIPTLTLYNPTLDIRMVGVNGAVIGRKQGPYSSLFVDNMYISGLHAQLIYKPDTGWCIIDKHSSNGTKLNQRDLLPDVPMSLKSGDIVTLANINLQVSIS